MSFIRDQKPTELPAGGKIFEKYSDDQARDDHGRWSAGADTPAGKSERARALGEKAKASNTPEDHKAASDAHFAAAREYRAMAAQQHEGFNARQILNSIADDHYLQGDLHQHAAEGRYQFKTKGKGKK